jgi:hypothetical protein
MTKQSPRIYVYKITFEEVQYYYYGSHKEKKFGEHYMGSPVTNKWVWNHYTPQIQILQCFEFSDEGYRQAREIENRLVGSVFNKDRWCLNEHCGGTHSLKILKENGQKTYELGIGVHGRTKTQMSEDGRKAGQKNYENGTGCFSLTPEQRSIVSRRAGQRTYENGTGIFSMTLEKASEARKKGTQTINSRKYQCTETGYISTAGPLSVYQKARRIDTSNRVRIQ